MQLKNTSLLVLGSAALFALTGCGEDAAKVKALETEVSTLKTQLSEAQESKKKVETELTTLKSATPPPSTTTTTTSQLPDDKLKPAFEEAAKKFVEELKSYFTADKIASLLSPVPPASVTGLTVSEVATVPAGTIVYTPPDKLRTFPYESSVKVTFQLTGGTSPAVLELPAKADSAGVWVFPTAQEVEARLQGTLPRSTAATNNNNTPPPGPSPTNGPSGTTNVTPNPPVTNAPPITPTSNPPSSGKAPRKGEAKTMDSH
ncbi:MAG: hypothetical protein ACAI35_14990 [Candidatus Methylacidiphilales bacterium]|nr:hypothetical protein [Candidatus Methylacidiphilales bacterium]